MATIKKNQRAGDNERSRSKGPSGFGGAPSAKRKAGGPKIRSSHAEGFGDAPAPRRRTKGAEQPGSAGLLKPKASRAPLTPKAPLAGPKRAARPRKSLPPPAPSSEARELALGLAAAGLDKKAIGVEILDVTGKVDYADFLVVMTGRSDRHVNAIALGLEEAMKKKNRAPLSVEGLSAATWVLMDFDDVIVHVFQEETRAIYDIEGLWIDAGRVPVPADAPTPPRSTGGPAASA